MTLLDEITVNFQKKEISYLLAKIQEHLNQLDKLDDCKRVRIDLTHVLSYLSDMSEEKIAMLSFLYSMKS